MSGTDKRTVATDALETLGTIINESAGRDAIHLAVEPVVAGHPLRPGEDVGFMDDGTAGLSKNPVGIVDPFLKAPVQKGERFWLVVYPRQITSLRHVWTHPAFVQPPEIKPDPVRESQLWIEKFCATVPVKYADLMYHAKDWIQGEEYWCDGGRFEGESVPDEFWKHYQIVTGETVEQSKQGNFFTCSC